MTDKPRMVLRFLLSCALLVCCLRAQAQECLLPPRPIQDQDGLPSCAANTAALLLAQNLGLDHELSYFQLYILGRSEKLKQSPTLGATFAGGNPVCQTINSAQRYGHCQRGAFVWDGQNFEDASKQQELFLDSLRALQATHGHWLEKLQNPATSSAEKLRIRQQLAGCFQRRQETCGEDFQDFLARRLEQELEGVMRQRVEMLLPSARAKRLQELYQRTFTAQKRLTPSARSFLLRHQWGAALERSGGAPPEPARLQDLALPSLAESYEAWAKHELGALDGLPALGLLAQPRQRQERESYEECRRFSPSVYLAQKMTLNCHDLPPVIEPRFYQLGEQLIQQLEKLRQRSDASLEGIVQLMAPECERQMRTAKAPANWQCETRTTAGGGGWGYARARAQAERELCEQRRAVGVTMCIRFFSDGPRTAASGQNCEEKALHAMALVGVRRGADGKKNFLVQNSWGRSCPFLDQRGKLRGDFAGLASCEQDASGVPTGRFWVTEELFQRNLYDLHFYGPKR